MRIIWIANEKQFNLVLPLAVKAGRRGVDFEILAVDRFANSFGEGISAIEVHDYLARHGLRSTAFSRGSDALEYIQNLKPDYIFSSTPYDLYFSPELNSGELRKYGTLCNLAYGASVTVDADLWDRSNGYLLNGLGIHFVTHQALGAADWSVSVGNVKLEGMPLVPPSRGHASESPPSQKKVIGWRPRWILHDERVFEDTMQTLLKFCREQNYELRFFPHPLMATELAKVDRSKFTTLRSLLSDEFEGLNLPDFKIVEADDYLWALKECSVLVAEASTLMNEAYSLDVPVIYIGEVGDLNERGRQITMSGAVAKTPEELRHFLNRLLLCSPKSRGRHAFWPGLDPTDRIFIFLVLHKFLRRLGISKPTLTLRSFFGI